ncbi:Isopenicillin N epimerase component 1 [Colletotrichum chlorophyti]|uniref:Isopenicillin N epimerase component 1 n=1 Tax=Colletotrichum chlorophyti TaxID=708187 RepID=A0A1Q8S8X2_9PEZI|nr:Isopenicillin N epimerase component 1 [Colletotrichum chlorophyti]
MYLEAKFHLSKDITSIRSRRAITKAVDGAVQADRVSPYYIFERAVQRRPYDEAIWSRAGSVSWKAAYDRANQYAQFFLSHGVKPGDFVALCMQNSPDFAFAWVGLLAIRAAPAMINYNLNGKALLGCLEISTAKLVLIDGNPETATKCKDLQTELDLRGIKVVNVDEERPHIYHIDPIRPPDDLRKGMTPSDPMAMFYTSASQFWDDIRDSRATWFVYVGETLRYLLAAPPSPRDKEHHVTAVFGNGCRPDVWKRFQERFGIDTICEFYNSTEGTFGLRNLSRGDFFANAIGHHGLISRFKYRNTIVPVAVDAETGEIQRDPKTGLAVRVPYEVGGEVLIEHPGERAFPGYFNNEEATNKKFAKDVLKKGDCYYRTGDSMRRDSEGRWFFLDRLGDTYRWKGENVSTAEVSEVLGNYPGVNEAVVYGVELPGHDGKAGAAALHIAPDRKPSFDFADFLRYSRSQLPRYAVPIFIRLLNETTASHNNKQNKVPLKNEGVDPSKVAGSDQILWIEKHGKGNTYVPFTPKDWESLSGGRARL